MEKEMLEMQLEEVKRLDRHYEQLEQMLLYMRCLAEQAAVSVTSAERQELQQEFNQALAAYEQMVEGATGTIH
ncbi:hypothetical protein ACFO4L_10310 [Bacillus daqingensis]|uniref:Uncharacterized protein n=1 Tax=Bacillus daqingensis TaxID=872396 RepID=A0ABV9NZI2_9BACI